MLKLLCRSFQKFQWPLVLIDQIQDNNHEVRGSLVNQLCKIIPLLIHQMAHSLIDALILFLHNREQAHDAMAVKYLYRFRFLDGFNWVTDLWFIICATLTACGLAS